MERYILSNGIKIVYEYRKGNITSFCIGFNSGALEEKGFNKGIAHAVEHMVFKGTKNRNEFEINKLCDNLFGFNNAMTNFPYAIYYGTVNSEEFDSGFELYSDILMNPVFREEGFKEEINVILEELKEWREDAAQSCEDFLLRNAFRERRISELIIGSEDSLQNITLGEIKRFYETYYSPGNCVVSVVTSLDRDNAVSVIEKHLGSWKREVEGIELTEYEDNIPGVSYNEMRGCGGAKISYLFPVHTLNEREIEALNLFNLFFGEGVSSILYDEIRTKNGLAYEVASSLKNERGIKFFNIFLSTSVKNVDKAITLIDIKLQEVKNNLEFYNEFSIQAMIKRIRMKRELAVEKSIELSKKLAVYELMYGRAEKLQDEINFNYKIDQDDMINVVKKVLVKPTIQVIKDKTE